MALKVFVDFFLDLFIDNLFSRHRPVRPKTLNELSHLRESMFGQPVPRHGLSLLWWFAHECVHIDKNGRMIALCEPTEGDFGFRRFKNQDGRLPDTDLLYYEVGDLNSPGLLPHYVTLFYDSSLKKTNADRIIVLVDSNRDDQICFKKVYVTQLDWKCTYRISQGLIQTIKNNSRTQFLRKTELILPFLLSLLGEYYRQQEQELREQKEQESREETKALCLCCAAVGIVLICAVSGVLYFWFQSET